MATLREVRQRQGLSQRALATRAGVSLQTVYLIETGRVRPRFAVMREICRVLGVAPQEIDEFRKSLEAPPALREASS